MIRRFKINKQLWEKHFETKSLKEIANELGVSETTVSFAVRYGVAQKKLAERLYELDKDFLTHTIFRSLRRKNVSKMIKEVEKPFKPEHLNSKKGGEENGK